MRKRKYVVGLELSIFLEATISGHYEQEAADKFASYVCNGNYDRQINRELNKNGHKEINVLYVKPVWRTFDES